LVRRRTGGSAKEIEMNDHDVVCKGIVILGLGALGVRS
jgi:myo-inositol catabolism protein IolC